MKLKKCTFNFKIYLNMARSSIEGVVRDNKLQELFQRLEGNGQHNRHPRFRMPVGAYGHGLLLLNKHYE